MRDAFLPDSELTLAELEDAYARVRLEIDQNQVVVAKRVREMRAKSRARHARKPKVESMDQLRVGVYVWRALGDDTRNKLSPRWDGPHQIVEIGPDGKGPHVFRVRRLGKDATMNVHGRSLRPVYGDDISESDPDLLELADYVSPNTYVVDDILGLETTGRSAYFFTVSWKGWEGTTVQPAKALYKDVPATVEAWIMRSDHDAETRKMLPGLKRTLGI